MSRLCRALVVLLTVTAPLVGADPPVLTHVPLIVRTSRSNAALPNRDPGRSERVAAASWGSSLGTEEACGSDASRVCEPHPLLQPLPALGLAGIGAPGACTPAWQVRADWLYLQARGNDFPYAVPACDCYTPDGQPGVLDMNYQSGLRWGVGRAAASGWLEVSGTHYLSETSNAVGTDVDHQLRPLVLLGDPGGDINSGAARTELKFWTLDAQYRQRLLAGETWYIEGTVGARATALDQNAKFYFDSLDSARIGTDVRGAGPRLGLQATKEWGHCFAWGGIATTLLAAQVDLDYVHHRPGAGYSVAEYHGEDDRLVPILDLELGIGYRFTDNWSVAAGYLYSVWFNVVTPVAYTDALLSGDLYNDVDDTLSFDGMFLRLEYSR